MQTEKQGRLNELKVTYEYWKEKAKRRYVKRSSCISVDNSPSKTIIQKGLNRSDKRNPRIIVSLTSYPERISKVAIVIESLLAQTVRPDGIVLWLGEEKFPDKFVPDNLSVLQEYGVEIRFKPDLKSHTKYFYALQDFPEDIVVTVDDDVIYHNTLLEELYDSYKKNPECVSAMRAHKMRFNLDGSLMPYKNWIYEYTDKKGIPSHRLFATGVTGVLYPPGSLHNEFMNKEWFKKNCYYQDDVWLKIMEVMNGTRVVLAVKSKEAYLKDISIDGTQEKALYRENVYGGRNDAQIKSVMDKYNAWFGEDNLLTSIISADK